MRFDCPDAALDATLLGCNHDDYFNTDPASGDYLATHWNPANNRFLTNAPEPPPADSSASPASYRHQPAADETQEQTQEARQEGQEETLILSMVCHH